MFFVVASLAGDQDLKSPASLASVWRHAQVSQQIRPRLHTACCLDAKQQRNNNMPLLPKTECAGWFVRVLEATKNKKY